MKHPEELGEIAERVQKGNRPRASVRTVLKWFEAERRGLRIRPRNSTCAKARETNALFQISRVPISIPR